MTVKSFPSPSEPDSLKLSRSGGFRIKPSMKDSMVLLQDTLEDHTRTAGGGGNGGRGGRSGGTLQRRTGSSALQNPFSKQQRQFTARIVAMGDDRVLGRLAKEYYFFRWGTGHKMMKLLLKELKICVWLSWSNSYLIYIFLFHCAVIFSGNWDDTI